MSERIPYTSIVFSYPEGKVIVPCIESRALSMKIVVTQKDADTINNGIMQAVRETEPLISIPYLGD